MEPWVTRDIKTGGVARFAAAQLVVHMRTIGAEWQVSTQPATSDVDKAPGFSQAAITEEVLDALDWKRLVTGTAGGSVQAVPVMPDRPLVIRPRIPTSIPPGGGARFYVAIPVWAEFVLDLDPALVLACEPTVILSNTWLGDLEDGELCYSLDTRLLHSVDGMHWEAHEAACPVSIRNRSSESLEIPKFCLRTEHLRIYEGSNRLWSNRVKVDFLGHGELSRLDIRAGPPDDDPKSELIRDERKPFEKNAALRTFGQLRQFQNWF